MEKFDFNLQFSANAFKCREEQEFIRKAKLPHKPVMFENAESMAEKLDVTDDYFCLVSGSFIFGDFLEALCKVHDLQPDRMFISTLGMSENNIDSIVNLVDYLGVKYIGLIISSYFYSVERNRLIPYLVKEFSGRPIQVGVCASHTKICLIESARTGKLVISGSANLSSSSNVEAFEIMHDPDVFAYCEKVFTNILGEYWILDEKSGKSRFKVRGGRGEQLWNKVREENAK